MKTIEMMLHTTTKKVEIFEIQSQDVASNFNFTTEVGKVEKDFLINISNLQYEVMINQFLHLKGIHNERYRYKIVISYPLNLRSK